jgi:flagellar biogenesis protein FliO
MMDTVWKLMWALPLVLAVGVAAVLMLKRIVVPSRAAAPSPQRVRTSESLQLSEHTHVHLLDVDGRSYVVVESTRHVEVQVAASDAPTPSLPRFGVRPSLLRTRR